jgi:hypothetical protein
MSSPAQPLSVPQCTVCGAVVGSETKRCPNCNLALPAARGTEVLGRTGLWMLAGVMLAVYAIVLVIVAAAR